MDKHLKCKSLKEITQKGLIKEILFWAPLQEIFYTAINPEDSRSLKYFVYNYIKNEKKEYSDRDDYYKIILRDYPYYDYWEFYSNKLEFSGNHYYPTINCYSSNKKEMLEFNVETNGTIIKYSSLGQNDEEYIGLLKEMGIFDRGTWQSIRPSRDFTKFAIIFCCKPSITNMPYYGSAARETQDTYQVIILDRINKEFTKIMPEGYNDLTSEGEGGLFWSHDSKKIAFIQHNAPQAIIDAKGIIEKASPYFKEILWVYNIETKKYTKIFQGNYGIFMQYYPWANSWSPDDKKLILAIGRKFIVAKSDGTSNTVIFSNGYRNPVGYQSHWSPDSKHIAFMRKFKEEFINNKTIDYHNLWIATIE